MTDLAASGSAMRERLTLTADVLAVAVVAALPWSTSATGIFAVLWLLAVLPTLEIAPLRQILSTPAGGLPVALVALGALGMLWADVSWIQRWHGLESFLKLLTIPLLLLQFQRSGHGLWALWSFIASASILLLSSWLLVLLPGLFWQPKTYGVPVKDYISQSEFFTIAIFLLLDRGVDAWNEARYRSAILPAALAVAFLLNILFVATGRTALVVAIALVVLFGFKCFSSRALVAFFAVTAVAAALVWLSSPYLRFRVVNIGQEIAHPEQGFDSSAVRLDFWRRSIVFMRDAPVIGHGTGSIPELFRRSSPDPVAETATNPHNQIFAVGIQIGLVGVALLIAMWLAHAWMFFPLPGFAAWAGLVVVTQNAVGSLFNSHLFDFTQGWTYAFGVGIAGGMVLRRNLSSAPPGNSKVAPQ